MSSAAKILKEATDLLAQIPILEQENAELQQKAYELQMYKDGRVIDLNGPEGNAFAIMARVADACDQIGIDFKPIEEDMMSGDYNHLIEVFEKHLGAYFLLINKPKV